MELSEYKRSSETVLCESTAMLENNFEIASKGDLACTDSRLLFADGSEVTDIRLGSVTEIVTRPPSYWNNFSQWGFLFTIFAFLAFVILPQVPPVEAFAAPVTAVLLIVAVVEVILAIYYAKWTVKIRTANSKYRFVSSDDSLKEIPHAVRGAE